MPKLEEGGEAGASGAVSKTYDKYGKRQYGAEATPTTRKSPLTRIKGVIVQRLPVFLRGR